MDNKIIKALKYFGVALICVCILVDRNIKKNVATFAKIPIKHHEGMKTALLLTSQLPLLLALSGN